MNRPTGGKGRAVDPSPLRTRCQECHGALVVVGAESFADRLPASGMHASAVQESSMSTSSRMDSSYVVLSKNNRSQGLGIPPRPRSAAAPHIEPNHPPRLIEGSYIMLPPPAASIYKTSVGRQLLPPSVNSSSSMPGNNSGFFSNVTVLKRAFEIATSQTQVEQPLCLECMRILSDKMDFEIEDISSDIKPYEASLQHLEQESYSVLSETGFQKEKQKLLSARKTMSCCGGRESHASGRCSRATTASGGSRRVAAVAGGREPHASGRCSWATTAGGGSRRRLLEDREFNHLGWRRRRRRIGPSRLRWHDSG